LGNALLSDWDSAEVAVAVRGSGYVTLCRA
jgi:hypothetical protein